MSDNIPERKKIHELPKQMADKIAAGEVPVEYMACVFPLPSNAAMSADVLCFNPRESEYANGSMSFR